MGKMNRKGYVEGSVDKQNIDIDVENPIQRSESTSIFGMSQKIINEKENNHDTNNTCTNTQIVNSLNNSQPSSRRNTLANQDNRIDDRDASINESGRLCVVSSLLHGRPHSPGAVPQ